MPKYLLSGTDAQGRRTTEALSAPSADDATHRFRQRGFSDVILHSDEVLAHTFPDEVLTRFTPQDCVALGRMGRGRYLLLMTLKLYRQLSWIAVLDLLLFVGRRALSVPWGLIDTLSLALLLSPAVIVLLVELVGPGRKFERVMAYNAWARWAAMLHTLRSIRGIVPAPRYAFFEAKALAGLGRLDAALEVVQPFAEDPRLPAWLYWDLLADVFHVAKLPDRAIECMEKAVESAPDNPTVLLDLAMPLLRYRRDAARARPLLERAREHEITDMLAPFLLGAEGVLALEEGRPDRARELLEEAVRQAQRFRHATALVGGAIDALHTYLTLACAAAGDQAAAEEHFRLAEPRLRAFEATDLIERCEATLGRRA